VAAANSARREAYRGDTWMTGEQSRLAMRRCWSHCARLPSGRGCLRWRL